MRKLAQILGDPLYRNGLRHGVAATVEHSHIPLPEDVTQVLDVGAHRGQFALFARRKWPSATIHSFEPQPGPVLKLRTVLQDVGNAAVYPVALGSCTGTATIHIAAADDSSSLLPIGPLQTEVFNGTEEVATAEVEVRLLDEVLPRLDVASHVLAKIDVQGFELDVLRGAEGLLSSIDTVLIELSFAELYIGQARADEVVVHLVDRGFRLTGVYGVVYERRGKAVQADFLFRRERA